VLRVFRQTLFNKIGFGKQKVENKPKKEKVKNKMPKTEKYISKTP
jgi:hypothetical protein